MQTLAKGLIGFALLVVLAIVSLTDLHPSTVKGAEGPTVTIDPAQLPLPVKGSATIEGTVAATQSGAWNVGISGNNAAAPLLVKNVNEPGRLPYDVIATFNSDRCVANCSNFDNIFSRTIFDLPSVPAGKKWVVTHVSGFLPSDSSTEMFVAFQNRTVVDLGGGPVRWGFYGPFFPILGGHRFGFSTPASFVFSAGETPHVQLVLPAPSIYENNNLSVDGYLIDDMN